MGYFLEGLSRHRRRGTHDFGCKVTDRLTAPSGRGYGASVVQPDDGQWLVETISSRNAGCYGDLITVAGVFGVCRLDMFALTMRMKDPSGLVAWMGEQKNVLAGIVAAADLSRDEGLDISASKIVIGGERSLVVVFESISTMSVATPLVVAHCECLEPPSKSERT